MAREEEGFFDELARGLADGSLTRGKALRLMGAALVGGTLASLGIREAGADPPGCKRLGKNCTRDTQCCGNLVCPSGSCQTPTTTTTETPTTTTTTPMPRHVFNCLCDDGTIPEECLPLECGPSANFTIACEQLCANRGGCSNTACLNSGCDRATC
jgi:hypothetical protein